MRTVQFLKANTLFLSIAMLFGCNSSNHSSAPHTPTTFKDDYTTASQRLEANGVRFSESTVNGVTKILLEFKHLNEKVKNAASAESKVQYLTAAHAAMKDFSQKSLALLQSNSLEVNEYHLISKKRNMVEGRLESINGLISIHQASVTVKNPPLANGASYPYNVKIGSAELLLCEHDFNNPLLNTSRNEILHTKDEMSLTKLILCSADKTIVDGKSLFSKFDAPRVQYRTGLYVDAPIDCHNSTETCYRVVSIPEQKEFLKNTKIEAIDRSSSGESQWLETSKLADISVEISILELLYLADKLADKNNIPSVQIVNLIEKLFLNDSARGIPLFFRQAYEDRNQIISHFVYQPIKALLQKKFATANVRTTEEIIKYIVQKDYSSLQLYANAQNCNQISYDKSLQVTESVNAYGLSPLMVAALLEDNVATNYLINVNQIDPNLESPVFKQTYTKIRNINRKAMSHIQLYSGSYTATASGGSSYKPSQNLPPEYSGYTALMVAVAEDQCEIVSTIIEAEPYTLNYKSSNNQSALKVSIKKGNNCLMMLLEAGAYDFDILNNSSIVPAGNIEPLDFVKFVPDSALQKDKHQVPNLLVYGKLAIPLKVEIQKRTQVSNEQVKDLLKQSKPAISFQKTGTAGIFHTEYTCQIDIPFDLHYLNFIGLNLAEEPLFGPEKSTLPSFVFEKINICDAAKEGAGKTFSSFIHLMSSANPDWISAWVNSVDSFKGQNPLVAASMFNEVGLVEALLTVQNININVEDGKTGFNALDWQYAINPLAWVFTNSKIASGLKEKGAVTSVPLNVFGTPNSSTRNKMEDMFMTVKYPFREKSETTTELVSR